jgi:hypothetical protein
MLELKALIENMMRGLLLGAWLNFALFVELTDQQQLAKGTLQMRPFTSIVSLYRQRFPTSFVANHVPHNANAEFAPRLCIYMRLLSETADHPGGFGGCGVVPGARAQE